MVYGTNCDTPAVPVGDAGFLITLVLSQIR